MFLSRSSLLMLLMGWAGKEAGLRILEAISPMRVSDLPISVALSLSGFADEVLIFELKGHSLLQWEGVLASFFALRYKMSFGGSVKIGPIVGIKIDSKYFHHR